MPDKPTQPRKFRLPHAVIVRSPGLLPMMYKVSELAQELDVLPQTIRGWVRAGLPHERDNRGHLWISGRVLAEWVNFQRRSRRQESLKTDEAFCVRCRKPVRLADPQQEIIGRLVILHSYCPLCGCQVYRGVKNG
jgi:transposase-like protein